MWLLTYRQQKVHDIHQTQHHIGDIVEAVNVSRTEKGAGNEMVGQHLVVVFASFLDVDHENLLHPEGQLHQDIPLHGVR